MPSFQYSKTYAQIEQVIFSHCQKFGRDELIKILSHRKSRLLFLANISRSLQNYGGLISVQMRLMEHVLTVDVKLGMPDHRSTGHGRIFRWDLDKLFP